MYMPSSGGDGTTLGTDVSALATVMLVLSHVLIAAAVPFLVLAHLYYPASWALAVLVVSDIYHIARSSGTAFGTPLPAAAARPLAGCAVGVWYWSDFGM